MNKRIWISLGAFVVVVVVAYVSITGYMHYRMRHQEPWKLVADCEQDRVTRMKFGSSLGTPDDRYTRADKFAVLAKAKDVDEGTSRKKVTRLLGEPSFVEGTTTEGTATEEGVPKEQGPKFAGCEWHYVFAGRREPTGYFTEREGLVVVFDEIGEVKSKTEIKR
jgi:hypothetical protein